VTVFNRQCAGSRSSISTQERYQDNRWDEQDQICPAEIPVMPQLI